jgi:hypothetical protein
MSITADDVRAAVGPVSATPAAAPLSDIEIQRLLRVPSTGTAATVAPRRAEVRR